MKSLAIGGMWVWFSTCYHQYYTLKIWFDARAQILGKERELDSLKKRNEYLEAQIRDAVEKCKKEEEDLRVLNI